MAVDLSDISSLCLGPFVPGASYIEISEIQHIDSFPECIDANSAYDSAVTFNAPKDWVRIDPQAKTLQDQSKCNQTKNGEIWDNRITFNLLGDSQQLMTFMEYMKGQLFIVKFVERAGDVKLFGSVEVPMRFKANYDSGKRVGDFKGYRCEFLGTSARKSPYYPF